MGGSQSWSGHSGGEEKKIPLLPLPVNEPQPSSPQPSHYTSIISIDITLSSSARVRTAVSIASHMK